jgi:nitroreductase
VFRSKEVPIGSIFGLGGPEIIAMIAGPMCLAVVALGVYWLVVSETRKNSNRLARLEEENRRLNEEIRKLTKES